jgi:hypothetical protein
VEARWDRVVRRPATKLANANAIVVDGEDYIGMMADSTTLAQATVVVQLARGENDDMLPKGERLEPACCFAHR